MCCVCGLIAPNFSTVVVYSSSTVPYDFLNMTLCDKEVHVITVCTSISIEMFIIIILLDYTSRYTKEKALDSTYFTRNQQLSIRIETRNKS